MQPTPPGICGRGRPGARPGVPLRDGAYGHCQGGRRWLWDRGCPLPFGQALGWKRGRTHPVRSPDLPLSPPLPSQPFSVPGPFAPGLIRVPKAGGTRSRGGAAPHPGFCFVELGGVGLMAPGWGGRERGGGAPSPGAFQPGGWGKSFRPATNPAGPGLASGSLSPPAPSRRAPGGAGSGAAPVPGSQMMRAGLTLQDVARRQSSCHFSRQC